MKIRINKYLANKGIASRRKIDDLIAQGLVKLNGQIANLGDTLDPEVDSIEVEGTLVPNEKIEFEYILLNKPKEVLSSVSDDRERKTVIDLVPSDKKLYPVGRLDFNSTGLILLTNDGDLALKMTHPRYHIAKTYIVKTYEKISASQLKQLETGIVLEGKKTMPAIVHKIGEKEFKIVLFQGIKRQIREMCKEIGLSVVVLHRIKIGDIHIGGLKPGHFRHLTKEEILNLKKEPIRKAS